MFKQNIGIFFSEWNFLFDYVCISCKKKTNKKNHIKRDTRYFYRRSCLFDVLFAVVVVCFYLSTTCISNVHTWSYWYVIHCNISKSVSTSVYNLAASQNKYNQTLSGPQLIIAWFGKGWCDLLFLYMLYKVYIVYKVCDNWVTPLYVLHVYNKTVLHVLLEMCALDVRTCAKSQTRNNYFKNITSYHFVLCIGLIE